jgi:hypothetical protein
MQATRRFANTVLGVRVRYALRAYLTNPDRVLRNILWRLRAGRSEERHIFVVGAARAGTTLMQTLLGAHPALATVETETGIFTWQDLFRPDRHFGLPCDEAQALLDRSRDIVQFFDALAHLHRTRVGARRFVEKTPHHVRYLRFILGHFPNARVLNMLRDGRDCYCSAQSNPGMAQAESAREMAKLWREQVRARWRFEGDPRIMDVRYEDLTSEPERVLRRVAGFIGEQFDSRQLDDAARARDVRSQQIAFQRLGGKIDSSSQGRWRREMPLEAVAAFDAIAGVELRALGYA